MCIPWVWTNTWRPVPNLRTPYRAVSLPPNPPHSRLFTCPCLSQQLKTSIFNFVSCIHNFLNPGKAFLNKEGNDGQPRHGYSGPADPLLGRLSCAFGCRQVLTPKHLSRRYQMFLGGENTPSHEPLLYSVSLTFFIFKISFIYELCY